MSAVKSSEYMDDSFAIGVMTAEEAGGSAAPEKRCYTVEDLQIILGISRGSVYELLKKQEFRWFQIGGGRYRISKKSFDEWLDQML